MIKSGLILLFWLIVIPFCMGFCITSWLKEKKYSIIFNYLAGMTMYMALFQCITIANLFTVNHFPTVCRMFALSSVFLSVTGLFVKTVLFWKNKKTGIKRTGDGLDLSCEDTKKKAEKYVLWFLFLGTIVFQVIQTLRLTFPDGDDAYFVGTASFGVNATQMYVKIPYTGASTQFDTRHCLAPFPYFISFLSRISGVKVSVIAHSILPVVFLLACYGIYLLIAGELCREKREVPLFMLIVSTLFMFGNYSVYSMETFLLTRVRQGKASLGSFALPFGVYLLLRFAKDISRDEKKEKLLTAFMLFLCGLAAALLTTMGNLIYPIMLMAGGISVCIRRGKLKNMAYVIFACVPSGVMALLYLIIR